MNGENRKKQDLIAIATFILAFFIIFFAITRGKFLFGSSIDWESQHYLIPEYFRNLFYQTKDLLPDFAFHLGGGQNIYYFSYYGLLNPFILLSYFLPFIKMVDYIQILGCIIPILSTVLFYFYLRKHTSYKLSFFVAFLFLCAGPVIFHSHRHLMFINYFPFFMLALFGIDSFFEKGKITTLALSCFLIIMTSYYYSVGSLVALFCYGIYYGIKHKKWTRKNIILFLVPFIVAILMGMIILLPTFHTLMAGREIGTKSLDILSLFVPRRSFRFLLYGSYAIGLTSISLIATLYLLFTKEKENIFLGIIILLLSVFPICNFILNGTLYVNAKSLIPFLPIILIFIVPFFEKLFSNDISYKKLALIILTILLVTNSKLLYFDLAILTFLFFLHFKTKKEIIFMLLMSLFSFGICIGTNHADELEEKKKIYSDDYQNIDEAINFITEKENNLYRINNAIVPSLTMNKIVNRYHLASTLYSSTFNKEYNEFFFDGVNNPIPYRNRSMTSASSNPFFQRLMGEKYVITTGKKPIDSKEIKKIGNIHIYELNHVLPIGYASSNLISSATFENLEYPLNVLTLFEGIVVEDGNDNRASITKEKIDFKVLDQKHIRYQKEEYGYEIIASKKASLKIKLEGDYKDKFIFVRFKNEYNPPCGKEELAITINGIKNKLSCTTWKYHNKNFVFDYVFYDVDTFSIQFAKGKYQLSDFEIYTISKDEFLSLYGDIDEFIFDKKNTLGDTIRGTIQVSNDGYFTMSIPYDTGFRAWIDGKEVKVLKVNGSFIGFKIEKGDHEIKITYEAPYKKISTVISILGILVLLGIIVYEKRK